jgi:hypothetical protein
MGYSAAVIVPSSSSRDYNSRRRGGLRGILRKPRKEIKEIRKTIAQEYPRRRQLDGRHSFLRIQKRPHIPRKESMADTIFSQLSGESTEKGSGRTIMERLNVVDFSDRKINTLSGKDIVTDCRHRKGIPRVV